ncbi:MAG TPA: YggT family protein [Anaerolineales bacterium]|nr:YggT family protein [Anaerolineales bacterium]
MGILIEIIDVVAQILVLLVIVSAILSFFMDPYHPIRRGVDNIVQPMLEPIRRVVPLVGMFDFSPLILIILIQVVSNLLVAFLTSLR